MGKLTVLVALLVAAPGLGHEARMDKCGCHNQYGLRHCHPSKRTKRCERTVKDTEAKKAPPPAPTRL